MAGGSSVAAGPSSVGVPPAGRPADKDPGRRRRYLVAAGFLLPAFIFLGIWLVYPTIYTVVRSFYDARGTSFVGIDNYKTLFTTDILLTAIKNNAIWVLVVPALVTAIGLVFAVLTERIRWSVAFKTAVFMPMAISLFAAGVIWHIMYTQDPSQGTLNAAVRVVKDAVNPPGVLSGATPSTNILQGSSRKGFAMARGIQPGQVAVLGLTGIPPSDVKGGQQAVAPTQQQGAINGVVWRDFKPGGGKPGKVEQSEVGIPGVTLNLLDQSGNQVGTTTSEADGSFGFTGLSQGTYRVSIASSTFRQAYGGVPWLGPRLITPSIIIAYTWVWAGFAMVVIAAGLASIPRDVLEAARTDGATEWQVFRRVTVPLLAPVLSVVFITMIINVLKVFDIVLSVAPASVQDDANVIALAMWRTAFGGVNNFGLGAAIAVFLFIIVIPVLLLNVRRFRREG
jgi:alpha-glucoside transport system permease protein